MQKATNTTSFTHFSPTPLFHENSLLVKPKEPIHEENIRLPLKSTAAAKDFLVAHARLIDDMEILKGSMDDVFLAATGKELRETV